MSNSEVLPVVKYNLTAKREDEVGLIVEGIAEKLEEFEVTVAEGGWQGSTKLLSHKTS